MRFTGAQVALFKNGIRFVHLSPDEKRMMHARHEFIVECDRRDIDVGWYENAYSFRVCVIDGQSFEHAPVLFIEDEHDMTDLRCLREALMIAADEDGDGPMIVR